MNSKYMRQLMQVSRMIVGVLSGLFLIQQADAQKLSGQWTGGFVSKGDVWGTKTEYVLELEVKGNEVQGFSYTYFQIIGKRCYVICRLKGKYDSDSKSITVVETEKVKSNTPPDFRDCLQTHMLTYLKQGEKEVLRGKWKPATDKDNCGTGETELERKALVKVSSKPSEPVAKQSPPKTATTDPKATPKQPPANNVAPGTNSKSTPAPRKTPTTVGKTSPPTVKTQKTEQKPPVKANPSTNSGSQAPVKAEKQISTASNPKAPATLPGTAVAKLNTRGKQVIKTIDIPVKTFQVSLYDNGQIDGDTVSLYFNGKLMIASQKLSTTPIRLDLELDLDRNDNDLVMYAENLGSIPPNTALMIVTVGDKRYEVNITSTEQTNGTVRFKLKE